MLHGVRGGWLRSAESSHGHGSRPLKICHSAIPFGYDLLMNPARIKLRHLRTLVVVAQHRHLTRAAQAMAVTQPAVSKTLMELEDILGTPVIVRSTRGISLTQQGEVLVRYAGAALRSVHEGLEALSAVAENAPPVLAVGLLPTAASRIFTVAASLYRESFPYGRLKVYTSTYSDLLLRLKRGELDLVLGRQAEPGEMVGLIFEPLYSEPMVLVVRRNHPLLTVRSNLLHRLTGYPMLLPTEGTIIRHAADAFFLGNGVEFPASTVETVSTSFSRSYALSSDAVWFAPLGVVREDLQAGNLLRLPVATETTLAAVGLTLQVGSDLSPAVQAMVSAIRAVVASDDLGLPGEFRSAAGSARRRSTRF